jgi:hypothetical protein
LQTNGLGSSKEHVTGQTQKVSSLNQTKEAIARGIKKKMQLRFVIPEVYGVWGGMNEESRAQLATSLGISYSVVRI